MLKQPISFSFSIIFTMSASKEQTDTEQIHLSIIYRRYFMNQNMFCYQCQETAGCTGCTKIGVCGKTPDLAAMQDLLVFVTKGLAAVTTRLRAEGFKISTDINHQITLNLFVTITNANFDKEAIVSRIRDSLNLKKELLEHLSDTSPLPSAPTETTPSQASPPSQPTPWTRRASISPQSTECSTPRT